MYWLIFRIMLPMKRLRVSSSATSDVKLGFFAEVSKRNLIYCTFKDNFRHKIPKKRHLPYRHTKGKQSSHKKNHKPLTSNNKRCHFTLK